MSKPQTSKPWVIDQENLLVTHLYGKKLPNPWFINHLSDALRADTLYELYVEVKPAMWPMMDDIQSLWPDIPVFQHGDRNRKEYFRDVQEWLETQQRQPAEDPEVTETSADLKAPVDYKLDNGKLDYTLLMHDMAPAIRKVVECLHWGHHTKKYPREGYKSLPGGTDRLVAACYRHLAGMSKDFAALDEESGMPHVIHAITNLLMAYSKDIK